MNTQHSISMRLLGAALGVFAMTACGGGGDTPEGCEPGTLACRCLDNGRCSGSLMCEASVCIEEPCRPGTDGCPCAANNRCGLSTGGEDLTCQSGTCVRETCPVGQSGCACDAAGGCTATGDLCRDGYCQGGGCIPGELNCSCIGGGCTGAHLTCLDGSICVDATGLLGGPCFDDDTCNHGLRCEGGACVPCTTGTLDCSCGSDGECNSGLACTNRDLCAIPGEGAAPEEPVCFTPCESGFTAEDGTYRACPADGLMPGCIDDLICTDGSCVEDGQPATSCLSDYDCPDFQACIDYHCYSNCSRDGDCANDKQCYRHVCREPCTTADASCDADSVCSTTDGENGFCLPLREPTGEPQQEVNGDFTLSRTLLQLSNINGSETVRLTNNSPSHQNFVLRKRSHVRMLEDGGVEALDDPDDDTECNPAQDCPLTWLYLGTSEESSLVQSTVVRVDGGGGWVDIVISHAGDNSATRWQGTIEVGNSNLGIQTLRLSYAVRPEGQWQGTMYYFAAFGDRRLDEWRVDQSSRDDDALIDQVGNALIQRWGAFRRGRISWEELNAVLTATRSESWKWPGVQQDCPGGDNVACYLYDIGASGLATYSSDTDSFPIPTGVTEMPLAINLRIPDPDGHPELLEGRIESGYSMQYAGNPAVTVRFVDNPATCSREYFDTCINFIEELSADIFIGGRYQTEPGDTECLDGRPDGTFTQQSTPWLPLGFQRATTLDPDTGLRYRYECRDTKLPFASQNPDEAATYAPVNAMLSQANPIPDGRSRQRHLRVVDGALINQSQLFVLFEESFESFLDPSDSFKAYGYMVLERVRVDLDPTDDNGNQIPDAFEGSTPVDDRPQPESLLSTTCPADLVAQLLPYGEELDATTADDVVGGLIDGILPGTSPATIATGDSEEVHYLCADTGLFDGGPGNTTRHGLTATVLNDNSCAAANDGLCNDGGPAAYSSVCELGTDVADCGPRQDADADVRIPCPVGSTVSFFSVDRTLLSQAQIAGQTCQAAGTCMETLNRWRDASAVLVQDEPVWRCRDPNAVFCNEDRLDLRRGKEFYAFYESSAAFVPIHAAIDLAFRYRTRFVNRSGTTVGFAPEICIPNSDLIPYCYDPEVIEELRTRVDCLLHIWETHYDDLSDPTRALLNDYLHTDFSFQQEVRPDNSIVVHDGLERLYSELLIMMGDEAYTAAFASRFDLAESHAVAFEGSLFEENGVDLSGVAGYEMYSLYQAAQYYQEVLDRFYGLSPLVWQATDYGAGSRNFVNLDTVQRYFDKLVRASTQKSKAMSEIARRYQSFNRADLARRVVERAFTAGYLESVIMSRIMMRVVEISAPQYRPQLLSTIGDTQRRYRVAAAEMRKVYNAISDGVIYFGYPPDYVPLPALDSNQPNAFELIMARARERSQMARDREDLALSSNRSYNTDAAQFQAELARIRQTYESQLGAICGAFEGSDDRIHPAIEKYAELDPRASLFGDPCGLMGNGSLHDAMGQMELLQLDLQGVFAAYDNVFSEIDLIQEQVQKDCKIIGDTANFVYEKQGEVVELRSDIALTRNIISAAQRTFQSAQTIAMLSKCSMIIGMPIAADTDCPSAAIAAGVFGMAAAATDIAAAGAEFQIAEWEEEIGEIERDTAHYQTMSQCELARSSADARAATLLLRLKELDIETLKAQRRISLALSEIQKLHNEATRLQLEQEENEQLSINIEAARNDPNVRIYKNDAIINADFSFDDALREAYRATKVYEYYTSQSYGALEQLFLIRMVARGDYNLENYLVELENAFSVFEENYGNPDTRVQILSLRDDIMAVPRIDGTGRALSQGERIDELRARLADASSLDENGYLAYTFGTSLDQLSPLTSNHKVLYIEAEIIGSAVGDTLGRVYLRQQGTGVVQTLDGDRVYYRMPERTAVLDPFFNGQRCFAAEVYKSYRLRDRPYANTSWALVLNQRDEQVNQDIDLQSLTDIRLYVYYTDFTQF